MQLSFPLHVISRLSICRKYLSIYRLTCNEHKSSLRLCNMSEATGIVNTKFHKANLAVLRRLVDNGAIDNLTNAEVQEKYGQYFGDNKSATFISRLSCIRKEFNRPALSRLKVIEIHYSLLFNNVRFLQERRATLQ